MNQLFGVAVVHALEEVGTQAGSGAACYRVEEHEALGESLDKRVTSREYDYLEGVATVDFAIDHVKYLLLHTITSGISSTPIVCSAATIFADEEVLWVVDVLVRTTLYALYNLLAIPISFFYRLRLEQSYPRLEVN